MPEPDGAPDTSPTELQAIWFDATLYDRAAAEEWLTEHDHDPVDWREREDTDGAVTHLIAVLVETDAFDPDTFRTLADDFPEGISATVGVRRAVFHTSRKGDPMANLRAWSTLTVKAVDEDERILKGIASTPTTDRVGDIVVPKGAKFTLPLPLLSQHNHDHPIGHVEEAKAGRDGITVTARIVKDSGLEYVENAWRQIRAGLVRGLSIGFRPIEYDWMDDGGIKFLKWDWFELSAVTIPANADCSISLIKSIDRRVMESPDGLAGPCPGDDGTHPGQAALAKAQAVLNRRRIR